MAVKVITKDYNGNIISENTVSDGDTISVIQTPPPKPSDNITNNNKTTIIPLNKAIIALGTFVLTGSMIWYTGQIRYLWLLLLLIAAV